MNEPKPFASLSSGLLARKGQAKPAMRPQGFASFGTPSPAGIDDLGWNDMGHDRPVQQVGLTPMDADVVPFNAEAEAASFEPVEPVVFQQREDIERSFEAESVEPEERTGPVLMTKRKAQAITPVLEPAAEPVVAEPVVVAPVAAPAFVAPAPAFRAAPGSKSRAAFTLRLDQERHLKLRLAAAVTHRSAQLLVVEALDAFLANNPALAGITLPAAH
ncbi:MAG TPA: hypothetical protein VL405_01225 [Sphingomonas sp.]|jgi:hypothetical protein|nr:hypothetical protein [Sphingomonas sp.]